MSPPIEEFIEKLTAVWRVQKRYELTPADVEAIEELRHRVYENPKWTYGGIRR